MTLVTNYRHPLCVNCDKERNSCITNIRLQKGERLNRTLSDHEIVFILTGKSLIYCDKYMNIRLEQKQCMFFTLGTHMQIDALEESHLLVMTFDPLIKLCEQFSLDKLSHENIDNEENYSILHVNVPLSEYLKSLIIYIEDGFKCSEFFHIKATELLYLLSAYYTKKELAAFFRPIINTDQQFASFVHDNWQHVKSVKELAALTNYTPNSFGKKFKQVFNIPPYKWLNQKRAGRIFHELTFGYKSIQEISDEYGFNTVQQFNSFCKKNFHLPPGYIRNKKKVQ